MFAVLNNQTHRKMTTLEIKMFGRIMTVNINIDNNQVFITTNLEGKKMYFSYGSIAEAINNTTIKPVAEYLKSIA
jgi:hypothetical protein